MHTDRQGTKDRDPGVSKADTVMKNSGPRVPEERQLHQEGFELVMIQPQGKIPRDSGGQRRGGWELARELAG